MKTEILTACDRLITGSLNGICQGIIVAALVALTLRLLKRTNAATRHAVWFATLLVMVGLVAAHILREFAGFASPPRNPDPLAVFPVPESVQDAAAEAVTTVPTPTLVTATTTVVETETEPPPSASAPVSRTRTFISIPALASESSQAAAPTVAQPADCAETSDDPTASDSDATSTEQTKPGAVDPGADPNFQVEPEAASPTAAGIGSYFRTWFRNPVFWNVPLGPRVPRAASVLLLALWALLAGGRACILLWRLVEIRRLKASALPAGPELSQLFDRLRANLGVDRNVDLKVSPALGSPVLLGFRHPVVLLPEDGNPTEIESVLRHELAHVSRRDDWANLFQHSINAVFFCHPAVWWISRRLSLEREIACDDHVLQMDRPRNYALLLTELAGRLQGRPVLLAPGASVNKSQLQQRIDMILDTKRNASPRLAKARLGFITSAAALLAIVSIYAAPRVVLAQGETPPEPPVPSEDIAPPASEVPSADEVPAVEVAAVAVAAGSATASSEASASGEISLSSDTETITVTAPGAVISGPRKKTLIATTTPLTVVAAPARAATLAPVAVPAPVSPAVIVAPTPALPPPAPAAVSIAPLPPGPAVVAMQPGVATAPWTPRPPRVVALAGENASLERRLERVERMLEKLLNEQNQKPGQFQWNPQGLFDKDGKVDRKEVEKLRQSAREGMPSPKEVEKMAEMAKRQAEMAQREMARASEQAKRDAERAKVEQKRQFKLKEGSQKQHLEALRQQLRALERERERLDRQIEKLEQDQEQLEEQQDQDQDQDQDADLEQETADQPAPELQKDKCKDECVAQKEAAK